MATRGAYYNQERQNFARLSACILGPCTQMMRDLLRQHVAPANLRALVKQHVKVGLNYEQKKQLLTGLVPDYSNFDLTLIYLLLRTPGICAPDITPPSNNWGIPPILSMHITVGDDIERVRLLKNEHFRKTPELTQQEFNDRSAMITDIAARFDTILGTNGKFVIEINDLMTQPLDGSVTEFSIEQIQETTKEEQAVKETVGEMKKEVGRLTSEVGGLKKDAGGLTTEVGRMKEDIGGLKEDVGGLTTEIGRMKEDIGGLKKDVGGLATEVTVLYQGPTQEVVKETVDGINVQELKEESIGFKGKCVT